MERKVRLTLGIDCALSIDQVLLEAFYEFLHSAMSLLHQFSILDFLEDVLVCGAQRAPFRELEIYFIIKLIKVHLIRSHIGDVTFVSLLNEII